MQKQRKTVKKTYKNKQKKAKKANEKYHFFSNLNAFRDKSNLCANQKTSASGNGKILAKHDFERKRNRLIRN